MLHSYTTHLYEQRPKAVRLWTAHEREWQAEYEREDVEKTPSKAAITAIKVLSHAAFYAPERVEETDVEDYSVHCS